MQTRAPSFVDLLFRPGAGKAKLPCRASTAARRRRVLDTWTTDAAPETGERIMLVSGCLISETEL
jgi:hypothetical protein